jgi:hypothetical protein
MGCWVNQQSLELLQILDLTAAARRLTPELVGGADRLRDIPCRSYQPNKPHGTLSQPQRRQFRKELPAVLKEAAKLDEELTASVAAR